MGNLNAEQIKKALECCASADTVDACKNGCPIFEKGDDCECVSNPTALHKYALSLIKELTEENERLKELGTTKEIEKEIVRRETRADTVRKMQERLVKRFKGDKYNVYTVYNIHRYIDQIAKEMLEDNKVEFEM